MLLAKEEFFEVQAGLGLALTYDDIRLRAARSHVAASEVDIQGQFSRNVDLKTPLVSSPMDTVTESQMAITMAKLGGIGIIHVGLDIEDQRAEVIKVKRNLHGLIEDPISVKPGQTVGSVLAMCDEREFDFRTFTVTDDEGKLLGLLTQNDFDFCKTDPSTKVKKAMTPFADLLTAQRGTKAKAAYNIMNEHKKKTLPLIDKRGRVTGLYVRSDVERVVMGNPDSFNLDKKGSLRVGAAVPTDPELAIDRVKGMIKYLDVVVIDSGQGDSDYAVNTMVALKENFAGLDVVIGNISNPESARELAEKGADGLRVGQGGGSICTTRPKLGIGMPQVTAVYECAKAVRGMDVPICADGGIKDEGDVSIALAVGAHSVMMGNMLAGTLESPGEIISDEKGNKFKIYRGMGSASAMKDNTTLAKRYDPEQGKSAPPPQGIGALKAYSGSVVPKVNDIVSYLKSSMASCNAEDLAAHHSNTNVDRITGNGLRESHPHDVQVIS